MPRCFVIMPYSQTTTEHSSEYWTKHFDRFLKPLIEQVTGFEAFRSEALRQNIVSQIVTDLLGTDVVVADLTDMNPNVYWELGIRQSFKHGTITVAENGTKLPFDIGMKGTLFYHPKNHIENADFERQFKKALQDCIDNPKRPDSVVLETISGRGTIYEIIQREEATRRLTAGLSELERNSQTWADIIMLSEENQLIRREKDGRKGRIKWVTSRFAAWSVELLLSTRYVDADEGFYKAAEYYHSRMLAMNDALNDWNLKEEDTESWFLRCNTGGKNFRSTPNIFKEVKTNLVSALHRLHSRV